MSNGSMNVALLAIKRLTTTIHLGTQLESKRSSCAHVHSLEHSLVRCEDIEDGDRAIRSPTYAEGGDDDQDADGNLIGEEAPMV